MPRGPPGDLEPSPGDTSQCPLAQPDQQPSNPLLPEAEAGPSRPRTLNTMWGKLGSGSLPSDPSRSDSKRPRSPGKTTQARKRKQASQPQPQSQQSAQGRLVFSATGMSVATPTPEVTVPRKRGPKGNGAMGMGRTASKSQTRSKPTAARSKSSSPQVIGSSPEVIPFVIDSEDEVEIVGSRGLDEPVFVRKGKGAESTKPAHSFFSRPAASGSGSGAGTTPATTGTKVTTQHSFFSNGGQKPGVLRDGWGAEEKIAPWPGGEWPSHIGAVEIEPFEGRLALRPRPVVADVDVDEVYHYHSSPQHPSPSPSSPAPAPISFPPFILQHPAITAVLSTPDGRDNRETWCDLHRPRSAPEVLGNEIEAVYLRDWLSALSVGGSNERRIIRRVHRKRATNPDTDWIIDDIGMFGDPYDSDSDDEIPEPMEEPFLPFGVRPDAYPPINNWLANTILITGPNGVGKSAAVHAVAAELGWEVFEVYPGIGRRTGPHLQSLVGDVGKNHMVDAEKKKVNGVTKLFGKAVRGSRGEPIELDDEEDGREGKAEAKEKDKETRQSLILIDEADILFDERDTFWPAVVGLIAESRRPVVITCNDTRLIPTASLPLQTTLHFHPPPSHLAQAYLDTIAKQHNLNIDPAALYASCTIPRPDLVNQPLPPNGNEPAEQFDLRAAITQMQLDRKKPTQREPGPTEPVHLDIVDLERQMETASIVDAYIAPRGWELMEAYDIDHFTESQDDLDGWVQLLKREIQEIYPVTLSRAGEIAEMAVALGGGALSDYGLQFEQTRHIRDLLPILDQLVPLSNYLLPHPSLFLDFLPYVRVMVSADDALAAADRAAALNGEQRFNRNGRAVRGTAESYKRWIDQPDDALQAARGGLEL